MVTISCHTSDRTSSPAQHTKQAGQKLKHTAAQAPSSTLAGEPGAACYLPPLLWRQAAVSSGSSKQPSLLYVDLLKKSSIFFISSIT
jgi:hypothetical protein